jgi:hypothetical protein
MLWRKEKILALPGIEPGPFNLQPVAIPTELSRLQLKKVNFFYFTVHHIEPRDD